MYQLVKARHRKNRRVGRWVEADLSQAPVSTLTTVYGEVLLYITYPGLPEPKALRFDKTHNLRQGIGATMTVQEWLTDLGNLTLPWEEQLPDETPRLVQYTQAWHSGYDIHPRARYGHLESHESTFEQQDLMVTHPKFTPEHIDHHCLFTVNGFIHLSDCGTDGVRIVDGNSTVRKSNDNQVGILSFEDVGKIQKVPLSPEMLHKQNPESTYFRATYVTLPDDVDLENKTVLLVLGGYLQVLGKTYFRAGERTWRLELGNILFLERYIESVRAMDLSSVGLKDDPANPTLFSVEEMRSDEAMLAYLQLSQTFFVVVDTPTMFHEIKPLEYAGFPGRYINRTGDNLPVIGAYGRALDYHLIKEHGYWVYCCSNNVRKNYTANRGNWLNDRLVNGGTYPALSQLPADAYLRVLGTEG